MGSEDLGKMEGAHPRARSSRGAPSATHPHREQEVLWTEVLGLADYVETAFKTAIEALCEGRIDLVAEVRAEEAEIDRWEVRIEQSCLRALALYELVATDLRRVVTALRVIRELEGLADLAENLAKRARKLGKDPLSQSRLPRIRELARLSVQHVDASLRALRTVDAQLARQVIASDNEVDRLRNVIVAELKQAIRETPDRVNTWLRLINSARNLERASDHAGNIAVAVVYLKEGVLLHRGEEDEA
jgi:phosphate transport system protein